MVIVVLAEELVMLPDQLEKAQLLAGVAVSVMTEPPACGLKALVEIVQPALMAPAGATVVVKV
jgi:hypothetical protein